MIYIPAICVGIVGVWGIGFVAVMCHYEDPLIGGVKYQYFRKALLWPLYLVYWPFALIRKCVFSHYK